MPLFTTDRLNVLQLDAITAASAVGQKMWWLGKFEHESEMEMHIVTVTTSSENVCSITFESGNSMDIYEQLEHLITIHNDFVANTLWTDVKSRGESFVGQAGEALPTPKPSVACAGAEAGQSLPPPR